MKICPLCHRFNSDDAIFCTKCGKDILLTKPKNSTKKKEVENDGRNQRNENNEN